MSNEISVTVRGFCGTTPVLRHGSEGGRPWAQFRLASTPSVRDAQGQWRDGETVWLTVKTFGALAQNVADSLRKSDPVVVTGRLRVETWAGDDGVERTSIAVMADTVGTDLSLGTARFSRVVRGGAGREEDSGSGRTTVSEGGADDDVAASFETADEDEASDATEEARELEPAY